VNGPDAQNLFLEAARRGDAEVVRAFIEEGIAVNALIEKVRPLQVASGSAVVKELISAGADVNATSKEYYGPPLVYAAELGDTESIKALLDAGAKVNGVSPEKETALMKAAYKGNSAAVKALLLAGADVNLRASSGETALDYARHWLERERELEKHPDPFEDLTPEYEKKYKEIQDLLVSAGGEPKP
jgi:ankyrin repeat protein